MAATDPNPLLAGLETWSDTINAADAMFFKGEDDPRTRGTGHLIYVLDSIPDWDRFVRVWDRASRLLPPMHKRVVKPSGAGRLPMWQDDPNFDLNFHLRRISVPSPGTLREVFDYAEVDGMTPHDPGRPLWQVTLMEGLDGDRAAVLMKFHHSWLDGNAVIQLGMLCYDAERGGDLDKTIPEFPERVRPRHRSPVERVVGMPADVVQRAGRMAGDVGRLAAQVLSDPATTVKQTRELVESFGRLVTPVPAKPSPIMRGRSPRSRFEVLDISFPELRQAGKAIGCTLNDAYLAGVAGGFRRYHEELGSPVEVMPMGMPISTRADGDTALGNQAAATMIAAPVGIVDPVERMKAFHGLVLAARHEPAMDVLAGAAGILVHLPDSLMSGRLMELVKVDLGVSQVRGMLDPAYLAGSQIMRAYGFGPHTGLGAFVGMMTHLDQCCIGLHLDPAAVTEPALLVRCLQEGFDEVIAVGQQAAAPARSSRPAKPGTSKRSTGKPGSGTQGTRKRLVDA